MRKAYALLGLAFVVLLVGGWAVFDRRDKEQKAPLKTVEKTLNTFYIRSGAFEPGGVIPARYTCDGENVSPPLSIAGRPRGTVAYALIMDDPDIPSAVRERLGADEFVHWVLFNFPYTVGVIPEGTVPDAATMGNNSAGQNTYTGPCPPDREHRYFFRLYALDTRLTLREGAVKEEVLHAMEGHVLGEAQLMGTYDRQR